MELIATFSGYSFGSVLDLFLSFLQQKIKMEIGKKENQKNSTDNQLIILKEYLFNLVIFSFFCIPLKL